MKKRKKGQVWGAGILGIAILLSVIGPELFYKISDRQTFWQVQTVHADTGVTSKERLLTKKEQLRELTRGGQPIYLFTEELPEEASNSEPELFVQLKDALKEAGEMGGISEGFSEEKWKNRVASYYVIPSENGCISVWYYHLESENGVYDFIMDAEIGIFYFMSHTKTVVEADKNMVIFRNEEKWMKQITEYTGAERCISEHEGKVVMCRLKFRDFEVPVWCIQMQDGEEERISINIGGQIWNDMIGIFPDVPYGSSTDMVYKNISESVE